MRFLLLFLLFISLGAFAQTDATGIIYGICTSKKGQPLEGVSVRYGEQNTSTNQGGYFELSLPVDQQVEIVFSLDYLYLKRKFSVASNERKSVGKIKLPIQEESAVVIRREGNDGNLLKLPALDLQKLPTTNVERTLVYTTAASSNNELTSNYNVRGGSYDENLVYVNGFLINRPFLTRSGQQEGLSFIYSSLVKDIRFSAGGFDARYGDKLSSVLDISYLTPDSLNASLTTSLLGVESHIAHKVNSKLNYLAGARYRSNGYLLNSLPTKGAYNPVFYDGQFMVNYNLKENIVWSTMGHISSNNYRFSPQTQETDFGTVNEAYRLKIYFEGQEQTVFQTMTGGTALKWKVNNRLQLDFYTSVFHTNESENFDVLGQYYINLLETNPGKENFGDSVKSIGIGSFMNHARNNLKATILNVYHNGSFQLTEKQKVLWGINYQKDNFDDVLSEWKNIDSAGYSLSPINNNTSPTLELNSVTKGKLGLQTQRISGFAQHTIEWGKPKARFAISLKKVQYDSLGRKVKSTHLDTIPLAYQRFQFQTGIRAGYTEINNEFYITPRISFTFYPRFYFYHQGKVVRRNAQLRVASGIYYQPPFYREFRTFEGKLNLSVQSQKSFHFITGYDYHFSMWNRKQPFRLSTEAYYKYFWDVNPYEIDNVRTRYYADNNAVAYAYGLDVNVHGEFVEGIQSFFKVGLLSTKENILNDSYWEYRNASGEKIIPGYSVDEKAVDSTLIKPGFIPRPTDQLLNFAILFQDKMPNYEMLSAQMGLVFGSRLPYGPPDFSRYKDTLRQKSYFRVDLGLSYDLLHKAHLNPIKTKRTFSDAVISFEVFNLMGINNVLSKQWVQDISGKFYAIPNYLTQRRFNLKLILRM
jgi:hypothetical protein